MSTAGEPFGRAALERLADAALSAVGDAHVEAVVDRRAEGLTRFANSQVHQNVFRDDLSVTVRVILDGGRAGVVSVHTDDPSDVARAANQAADLARLAPPDPEFAGLSDALPVDDAPFDEATAAATPADRAAGVKAVLDTIPDEYEAAGAFRTSGTEFGVFTSTGQRAYTPGSIADLTMVVMGPSSSGFATAGGRSIADVDGAATGRIAVEKTTAGRDPVDADAGSWPVVLEPSAVAALVQFLGFLGFGGRDWLEGRAFTSGRLGEQVVDPKLTIADDPLAAVATGRPFDHEGTPKRRVELIRDGVATAVVHDRHTAARAETTSTGHALQAPNPYGPMPVDPVLGAGDDGSIADLVAGCERGLLVTRFHYTNIVHPKETTITGMTRDGTFMIEDGRITRAVRNLRFTQSILRALATVEAISTETGYGTEVFETGARYPAMRLPAFTFSGTTSFG